MSNNVCVMCDLNNKQYNVLTLIVSLSRLFLEHIPLPPDGEIYPFSPIQSRYDVNV